jgi:hypothetical protein
MVIEHDLVSLQIEWCCEQLDGFEEWEFVGDFSGDLDEGVEEMRSCFGYLLEVMPVDGIADLERNVLREPFEISKDIHLSLVEPFKMRSPKQRRQHICLNIAL